ncbi:putative Late embryogenesis abundant protein, LEA_2 subgroup [Helianthus debilis subsp. tardiflorus]
MTTGKPEPSTHPYDPLPSTPQQPQPQYYVVLPFYSSSGHRRRQRLFRRYLYSGITILLLSAALFLLWPSDPYLQVVNLRLDRFKVNTAPISIDIVLAVRIKVRNPDVYSLSYKSLNVSVDYRGERLGFVTSDYGKVKAFGTSYIDATLVLDGAVVVSQAVFLIEDLLRGEIPLTTVSEIRGGLGVVLFDLPIKAKLSCEVVMNIRNQTIERQDCCPA